ncbi:hypothetical protein [Thalassotalea marina]|uniref:Uncharacterized protein n=1 Tax=Thalassotalea marina TaxID=1673741 RepID=A0A919BC33_9GAMM|nr:hypothetical protein [Thalassotalea marina]GHF78127.1 hypothetical protein GCM10017161_01460 [Thalassotalea marina]
MENQSNRFYIILCIMLVLSGYLIAQMTNIGEAWNKNFDVSDYLTLLVAAITFCFAYLGVKHNSDQRTLSVMPYVEKTSMGDQIQGKCGLLIKNYGMAPAINMKHTMSLDGKPCNLITFDEMHREIFNEDVDIHTHRA